MHHLPVKAPTKLFAFKYSDPLNSDPMNYECPPFDMRRLLRGLQSWFRLDWQFFLKSKFRFGDVTRGCAGL
ncbi:Uncharacterised protein [Halioglobus japonicus]|nr:Uncharacterised protein [Halioglobus japonicus]